MVKLSGLILLLLAVQANASTVIVMSQPLGAEVTIDGAVVGKTPLQKSLPAGLHDLVVSAPEYQPHSTVLEVSNTLIRLNIQLKPKVYPVDVLFDNAEESGWAIWDGSRLMMANGKLVRAPTTIFLPKGTHSLTLVKDGSIDIPVRVTVNPEGTTAVTVSASAKRGYSSYARCRLALIVGKWKRTSEECVHEYKPDGTWIAIRMTKREYGTYVIEERDDEIHILATLDKKYGYSFPNCPNKLVDSGDRATGRFEIVRQD